VVPNWDLRWHSSARNSIGELARLGQRRERFNFPIVHFNWLRDCGHDLDKSRFSKNGLTSELHHQLLQSYRDEGLDDSTRLKRVSLCTVALFHLADQTLIRSIIERC
jgi:hypothetical protein